MHANGDLIQGYLKDKLGFDGFVISDYNAIEMIPGDYATEVRTSVNAGVDMFMEPNTPKEFETALTAEVQAGRVSQARIDDAVSRVLRQKFLLGLFEHPYADRTGAQDIGGAAHRAVARKAAAESQVLLKNAGGALPLKKNAKIYVAGRTANDIGNQAGGWTITWQGGSGTDRVPGTSILGGILQDAPQAKVVYSPDAATPTAGSDVGVVVVGETPYSEGYGDVGGPSWGFDPSDAGQKREAKSLTLQPGDKAVVDKVCSALPTCVVLVVSGRPQVVTDQLGEADALVASGLPGTEGGGVADVLFGRVPFMGRLSMTWPKSVAQVPINVGDANYAPLFPFGWGLRTDSSRARLQAARTAAVKAHASAAALRLVDAAMRPSAWTGSGAVRDRATVTKDLRAAAVALRSAGTDRTSLGDTLVSVLRDVVMAVHPTPDAATSARIADADHALLVGRADTAATLLAQG
jgi:beta-glucosidase